LGCLEAVVEIPNSKLQIPKEGLERPGWKTSPRFGLLEGLMDGKILTHLRFSIHHAILYA